MTASKLTGFDNWLAPEKGKQSICNKRFAHLCSLGNLLDGWMERIGLQNSDWRLLLPHTEARSKYQTQRLDGQERGRGKE